MNEVNWPPERKWKHEPGTFLLTEGGNWPPGCRALYRDSESLLMVMRIGRELSPEEQIEVNAAKAAEDEIALIMQLVKDELGAR